MLNHTKFQQPFHGGQCETHKTKRDFNQHLRRVWFRGTGGTQWWKNNLRFAICVCCWSISTIWILKHSWSTPLKWLDDQLEGSVVYVSFRSRTALKRYQITEIGEGFRCRFLWVVKDKPVDGDEEMELEEVVGFDLMEKWKKKGLVVKKCVRIKKCWIETKELPIQKALTS